MEFSGVEGWGIYLQELSLRGLTTRYEQDCRYYFVADGLNDYMVIACLRERWFSTLGHQESKSRDTQVEIQNRLLRIPLPAMKFVQFLRLYVACQLIILQVRKLRIRYAPDKAAEKKSQQIYYGCLAKHEFSQ
jgi:hypothetical protein